MVEKKKRGAQPRNQNARKHGFYSAILNDAEKSLLERAAGIEGLDEEIAIFRIKLREIMVKHPENVQLAIEAANALTRLIRTRYNITRGQKNALKEAITRVITDIAVPLGAKILFK
jgi:hypothetical protein